VSWEDSTEEIMPLNEETAVEALAENWVFFCPWCGRRAALNSIRPLTVNCDRCECTTEVKTVT